MEGGGMLLPGERFCPMEDELLMFYLKPKVNGEQVPGNGDLICELDLYGDQDPWKIWEGFEARRANDLRRNKDLYFFTQKKKKSARSSRISRTVGSGGTWKGQSAAKEVYLLDQNQRPTTTLLGFKKTYTYRNKGSVHDGRWILYEFELDESQVMRKKQVNKNDYVLCLLRKNDILAEKKRKRQDEEMLGDYVEEEDGDDGCPESVTEEPQDKRQRLLSSMEVEQEQFLHHAPSLEFEAEQEQFLHHAPLLETEQEEFLQHAPSIEGEQDKRQRLLPSMEVEQEQFLHHAPSLEFEAEQEQFLHHAPLLETEQEEFLQHAPSIEGEQEAVATPLEDDEQLFVQVDEYDQADVAEILKWYEEEFGVRPTIVEGEQGVLLVDEDSSGLEQLEAEPQLGEEHLEQHVDAPLFAQQVGLPVNENSGLQQLDVEPQLGEENMEQQLDAPLFASHEIMNGLQFPPDENPVEQMGAEANVYGGNSSDHMVGEDWPTSFMEALRDDQQPMNNMEVGDWTAAAYSDFEYFPF